MKTLPKSDRLLSIFFFLLALATWAAFGQVILPTLPVNFTRSTSELISERTGQSADGRTVRERVYIVTVDPLIGQTYKLRREERAISSGSVTRTRSTDTPLKAEDSGVSPYIESDSLAALALPLVWFVFEATRHGGSPGKRIMRIAVVGRHGEQISVGRSLLRNVVKIFSFLLLAIGVLMIAFNRRKRGLHDLLAGTYVVRRDHPGLTDIFS